MRDVWTQLQRKPKLDHATLGEARRAKVQILLNTYAAYRGSTLPVAREDSAPEAPVLEAPRTGRSDDEAATLQRDVADVADVADEAAKPK